jgi:hypothetical protein
MSILRKLENRLTAQQQRRVRTHQAEVSFDEPHGENYFTNKVRNMDTAPEQQRGGTAYLHLSSLIGSCSRREVLKGINPTSSTHTPFSADRIVWALGRAAEHHLRVQFIAARKREGIVGQWKCKCGHTVSEGLFNKQVRCDRCRGHAIHFHELAVWDHHAKIFGNPDLIYLRPDNMKPRVVEIKSMNVTDFGQLTKPKPDHVTQALGYVRLLGEEGMDPDTEASVVYVCKDYRVRAKSTDANQVGGVYREFHVTENATQAGILDGMWERAAQVRDWRAAHAAQTPLPLPDRIGACPNPTTTQAKACDQCVGCFAR